MAKPIRFLFFFVLSMALLVPGLSKAEIVDVNSVKVTDVTPVHFAVVWATSEPATGSVSVFADADGKVPVTDAVVQFDSSAHPPAEDIGVMKVKVTNLKPNTTYYLQTKTTLQNGGGTFVYPESPPFTAVTTEQKVEVVSNDLFAQQINVGPGKSADGTLVIAKVDQASYPLTGWAGDGVPDGWIAIDMNNFYDKDTHSNLELHGGETITLTVLAGSLGTVEINDTVPAETGVIQAGSVVADLTGTGPVDTPPASPSPAPTSAKEGGGGGGGGSCFIATVSSQ